MRLHFCLDSGAHSIYNTNVITHKKGRKGHYANVRRSYDFYESQEFNDYLNEYIEFTLRYHYLYDFHVTVDAIGNPAKTQEITEYIMQRGLNPVPVFHYGGDYKYLQWMMDRCPLVGIGGYAQATSREDFKHHASRVFDMARANGTKIHCFALAAMKLIQQYPWYSVDATTAGQHARFGAIMVPQMTRIRGKMSYDYLDFSPIGVLSDRRSDHHNHVLHHTGGVWYKYLSEYAGQFGITVEQLRESFLAREILNEVFMDRLQQQVSEQRGMLVRIYRSGKFAMPPLKMPLLIAGLAAAGIKNYRYMATYYRLDGVRLFNSVLPGKPFVTMQKFRRERKLDLPLRPRLKPKFEVHHEAAVRRLGVGTDRHDIGVADIIAVG